MISRRKLITLTLAGTSMAIVSNKSLALPLFPEILKKPNNFNPPFKLSYNMIGDTSQEKIDNQLVEIIQDVEKGVYKQKIVAFADTVVGSRLGKTATENLSVYINYDKLTTHSMNVAMRLKPHLILFQKYTEDKDVADKLLFASLTGHSLLVGAVSKNKEEFFKKHFAIASTHPSEPHYLKNQEFLDKNFMYWKGQDVTKEFNDYVAAL